MIGRARLSHSLARLGVWLGAALLAAAPARAEQTSVAVAANFAEPAKAIAELFAKATPHTAVLSAGPSGQLYTQIKEGAPFEVFLSADAERPEQAVTEGLAVADSRFTYAVGRLVLYSRDPALVNGKETLASTSFAKLAIANPEAAPYGAAAIEVLKTLGVFERLEPKLVRGTSIAQAYQFVETGNAELGFVALSQVVGQKVGSRWLVPESLHTPILQQAVLLAKGAQNPAAKAFLEFLRGPESRAVIRRYGYQLKE